MTIVALFGKLREHEIEMNRLKELESSVKMVKNIALKSKTKINDEVDEDVVEFSENEKISISLSRSLESILKEEVTKVIKGGIILNKMNLIALLCSFVIIVGNNDTSKLSVQMLTKIKIKVLTWNGKASSRRDMHTMFGMIMMI